MRLFFTASLLAAATVFSLGNAIAANNGSGGSSGSGQMSAPVTMQSAAVANGNGTTLTVTGYGTALVNVNCSVACSGGTTINFEGTDSTGTYFSVAAFPVAGSSAAVNTATTSGQFWIPVAGLTTIRARISGYSAGTITVTGTAIFGQDAHLSQVVNANTNQSNASSGVATGSGNSPVVSYPYIFNGTTWDQVQGDPNKNLKIAPQATTVGGQTPIFKASLSTTVQSVKASGGQLGSAICDGVNTALAYLQIFNVASGSVTLGTTAPNYVVPLQTGVNSGFMSSTVGIQLSTAISVAVTTTPTGNTATGTPPNCSFLYN